MFSGKEHRAASQWIQQQVNGVLWERCVAVFVDPAGVPGPAPSIVGPVLDHCTFQLGRGLIIENRIQFCQYKIENLIISGSNEVVIS